jgi:major outer membrane protein
MNRFAKLALLLLCFALAASGVSRAALAATVDAQISARLDALEKENAALRARLNRLEASTAAIRHRSAAAQSNPALASVSGPQNANALAADVGQVVGARTLNSRPHFEVSGSLLFLQPGAGNLEYGTLVTPLPIATPNWSNQSLSPNFDPAFRVGARYMPNESNDIELNWTHLNTTTNGSFSAGPTQMVGPPYLIGPESALYKIAQGSVQSKYDAVNLVAAHTFCAECSFQLRAFGGVEFARIGQNLSGLFQSPDGSASSGYTTNSLFTGAGPRLGLKGQYALGDFQFIGEFAAAGLIGTSQSRINFTTVSPALAGVNNQSLTSPNATQVIPSIDARLATAYTFLIGNYGLFKIELGYQAAVYFNAVSQYSLTQVPTMIMLPPVGVFLATEQHSQSNFTDQGPYLTGSWSF